LGVIPRAEAAERMSFPGEHWEQATPESQHVDSDKLKAAVDYLEQHAGSNGVKRMVVIRNGRMIWRGAEADTQQRIWSVSKAFTSTAHGLLIEDGKCTLDTLAKDFNPRLAEHYSTVTLRHLATMTSGIDGVGGTYDLDTERRGDQNALVDPLPPFFAPGTRFMYWDEATQQYGYVLTKIAGESLDDYLKRRVLEPIGITRFGWQLDSTKKVLNWTGGIEISASGLARFGHLFLNGGKWRGRQLISASWVREATKVQVPATVPAGLPTSNRQGSGVYGYHWWPNGIRPDGKRRWPDAPVGTYERSGYNNNDLFVIPAWNMVIVRLGLDQREDEITTAEYNVFLRKVGEAILDPVVDGERRVWHPITVGFRGPAADETDDDPNPFLDYRLLVAFTGPSGQKYNVPGFFDGDGYGGGAGDVWRVRFSPDEAGRWTFKASFRAGKDVAVSLDQTAGEPVAFDGADGEFDIAARDSLNVGRIANPSPGSRTDWQSALREDGFLRWGRLEYVGGHYLKFRDGPYWIRGGTDSPENFLAYAGFDNTPPNHKYAAHVEDWRPGDPDWGDQDGRGIIGALNYLASRHVNSIYFLVMNIGGDGKDVWPWVGSPKPNGSATNDNRHYDISKLRQWETVFAYAQRKGIFLHFVFNEAERPNKIELDDGELGTERKLYYREIIARFAHHLALEWNLCEEYNLQFNFGPDRIRAFADYINATDPYDHPVTVHSAGDPLEKLRFTFGDKRFGLTSIQLNQRPIHEVTEAFRQATSQVGRPLPISLDEFTVDRGQEQSHVPVDDADGHRKEKLWPTYLSGGMIEFILDDFLETDSLKTPEREALWNYTWHARKFMQDNLPFWEMQPADELASGAGTIRVGTGHGKSVELHAQVFAKSGKVYAVYLPKTNPSGTLDISAAKGAFKLRWYNPRTGDFEGKTIAVAGGSRVPLGTPPTDVDEDWVVLITK